MNSITYPSLLLLALSMFMSCTPGTKSVARYQTLKYYSAQNSLLRYTGRIDFSNPARPRLYQPGVYVEAAFRGPSCQVIVHDQQLWGSNQNYLQVVIDGQSHRMQTGGATDTIEVANGLSDGPHRLLVCKNTEANIGWLEFGGVICQELLPLPPEPGRKIEFIGNSITCGTGADASKVPCGKGKWQDQHNAYLSYGPITARALDAQWHLSSVSGIGLIHSCCNMEVLMPQVFDKIDMRGDSLDWGFQEYQPDVVTICLGQNDGVQDSTEFCSAYVQFIKVLRVHYPRAQIVCLTSPMGDVQLTKALKNYLAGVVETIHRQGDPKVDKFFFSKQFSSGCDYHPNLVEHAEIAAELTDFLKKKMGW